MKRIIRLPSNCPLSCRIVRGLRPGLGILALLLAVGTTCGQGTVVAWGFLNPALFVPPPGLTNVIAVSAGGNHILALNGDGTAIAWGYNSDGQTNIPTVYDPTNVPPVGQTNVPPGQTNAHPVSDLVAISAGGWHNLALRRNGTVLAWGLSFYGATAVPAGLNDVMAISAGLHHSLVLRSNGTVVAWGLCAGLVGVPVWVPAGLTNVIAIAAGSSHDVALLADGHVVAWGDNSQGRTNVPAGLSNVVAIAAGGSHSLALTRDGTLVTWGNTCCGLPNIPPNLTNILAIAAGGEQSVVLQGDGTMVAWGKYNGQVGVFVPGGLGHVSAVAAGEWDTVALIPNQFSTWQPLDYIPPATSVTNGFCLRVWSLANHGVVLVVSSNLVDWEPIFTNPPGGGLKTFIDTAGQGWSSRFYRALVQ
jgi:alpha-tubulin suppressor-like RCC1 family protein